MTLDERRVWRALSRVVAARAGLHPTAQVVLDRDVYGIVVEPIPGRSTAPRNRRVRVDPRYVACVCDALINEQLFTIRAGR